MKITRFEDIEAWQEARKLVKMVYDLIKLGTIKKDLRLCSQAQAAATSVMANIAEGYVRRSDKEFVQFLFIAMSSAAEVQSHLYVAVDQGYVDHEKFEGIYNQAEKTSKLISGFIKYLRAPQTKVPKQTRQTKQAK